MKVSESKGLALYSPPSGDEIKSKVKDVAELYEKQFLREMVKAMRQTVPAGGYFEQTMPEKIYRDQLDNEYVEQWGQTGGIGLGDLIYKQLMEKFSPQTGEGTISRPQSPIPLQSPDTKITPVESSMKNKADYRIESNQSAVDLHSPWPGQVSRVGSSHDVDLVEIKHQNGLTSTFWGQQITGAKVGQQLNAGERLGLAQNSGRGIMWRVG